MPLPESASDLARLVLGKDEGFTPGSRFRHDGREWERFYVVRNAVRGARCPGYRIVEIDPHARGPYAQLGQPDHSPHGNCSGRAPHELLGVVATDPERLLAVIIDGEWRDLCPRA